MTTGEKIRELRKAQGLTQEELAQKIGIKRGTLAQYETGKRSPKRETLERFAKALNVQWYELAHAGDPSWDLAVQVMNRPLSNNAHSPYKLALELGLGFAAPDMSEAERERIIASATEPNQRQNSATSKEELNSFFEPIMRSIDTCMKAEGKNAQEAAKRIADFFECIKASNKLNEIGKCVAYYEAMQLLEPDLNFTNLIGRIWEKHPEKVKELLEILERTSQNKTYCKQDAAGDAPEDTDLKKD